VFVLKAHQTPLASCLADIAASMQTLIHFIKFVFEILGGAAPVVVKL
jgi:hypothetical protein